MIVNRLTLYNSITDGLHKMHINISCYYIQYLSIIFKCLSNMILKSIVFVVGGGGTYNAKQYNDD